ncbi:MAG: MFS transporter [Sphingomonadales bacterium]|nr:MFS transporter [Sphingomonadales bacterium]
MPGPTTQVYRNVGVLAISQGLFMSVQGMGIAASPLAGYALLGADKSLATLPIFLNHVGIMITTIPASLLMGRIGRRAGFTVGTILGVLFGLLGAYAIWRQDFSLLCASALLQGASAAFAWYYRFAAADASPPAFKPKAISLVMAGGVIAGFVGPQLAKWTVNWFDPMTFMGVYVAIALVSVVSLLVVQGVRIPSLTAAEKGRRWPVHVGHHAPARLSGRAHLVDVRLCGHDAGHERHAAGDARLRLWLRRQRDRHPDAHHCDVPAVVLHRRLIARFGVLPIIVTGAIIEVGCALVNLAGIDFMNFLIANALVGLGWNFTYVGGSTLLTQTYTAAERAKVQASHDFIVYATTAAAAALAGFLQQKAGWTVLNLAALPVLALVIAASVWLALHRRREAMTLKPAE